MRFRRWVKPVVGTFLAVTLGACTTVSPVKMSPEQAVMARAQERWNLLIAGQFEKSYDYITPAGRSTLPMAIYRSRISGGSWKGAKVTGAVCEPEVCEVTAILDVDVLPNLPHRQPITEKWLLDGEKWWYVYRG